jgi:transposase InsO family protein
VHSGYRRVHVMLRREEWRSNPKRVYRLYREMGLQLRTVGQAHRQCLHRIVQQQIPRGMFERALVYLSLDDAHRKCQAWRRDYNEERSHSAIGNKAPIELIDRSVAYGPR